MCSGSTASRPPPQATPTPGRQATWATTGNCQPRARQATGARRPANGLAASHTSTRPAPDSELSGDTHRPRPRHTPPTPTTRPPQPGRHRLGQQGHQAETTGHQPTFREHAETQATVQPGDPPPVGTRSRCLPGPAARGARRGAPPSFAFAPTVPQKTSPRQGTTKALPLWLHAPGHPRPNPLTPSRQSRCTPPTPTTRPNGVTPAPRAGVTPTNPYMVTARNDGGQRGSL